MWRTSTNARMTCRGMTDDRLAHFADMLIILVRRYAMSSIYRRNDGIWIRIRPSIRMGSEFIHFVFHWHAVLSIERDYAEISEYLWMLYMWITWEWSMQDVSSLFLRHWRCTWLKKMINVIFPILEFFERICPFYGYNSYRITRYRFLFPKFLRFHPAPCPCVG